MTSPSAITAAASDRMRKRSERADIDHHLEGLAEQEIADQHARLVAPHEPRRGLAPAEIALVDHIVVQQGGGVHELHARREPHMTVAAIAAELGRGERQHGPQALAAGIDEMPGKLGDQLDIRSRPVEDDAVDMGHVLLDKRNERRETGSWIVRAGKLNHNSQRTIS